MSYESRHYGETPIQLLNAYYSTRYVTFVTTCATQIVNFYVEGTRRAEAQNQEPPPNDGPGGNDPPDDDHDDHDDHDRRSIEGEEDDGTVDLTNPYLLPMLARAITNAGYRFVNPAILTYSQCWHEP